MVMALAAEAMEMKKVMDGWAEVVDKIAYRTYNFNLAETTVPFSKMLTRKTGWRSTTHSRT